ncbi:MAG: alpha/beta hydrolase [Sphingomonas bacterium]|nr:hydrolase 1, exosortase A system-associated [Sphingomonas bacterium]MDB5689680.1 alpha/beta hydrolase [Sphingomonas bacterium]
MRTLSHFRCDGALLGATLDDAPGASGATALLIVTGGTEIRIGAHGGLARLAAAAAAMGYPALRFDRRGIGDSEGVDPGFAGSGPDIAAAARHLRALCPGVKRVIGFGLCDGATALALNHRAAGLDGLILANPWVVEPEEGLPPPAAIRRRYLDRLLSLSGWRKALTGGIDYRAALRGVRSLARRADPSLGDAVAAALAGAQGPITIVLASGDATAIAFADAWRGDGFATVRANRGTTLIAIDSRSHSFASGDDPDRLAAICLAALEQRA